MRSLENLHVTSTRPLVTPEALKQALPVSPRGAENVHRAREELRAILRREDPRLVAIIGPCSIHDPGAARAYAQRLLSLRERVASELFVIMRVYFEKPRTTVGWKGLINDPHLDGSHDVATGLATARGLLRDLAELGLPAATEFLDPIIPQYLADLVTWTAIGARTTESQTHREMASGLSMPVGYKNGTDGNLAAAMNALVAAARPHRFLGIDGEGRVAVVSTAGNPDGHVVLRGGAGGPNYDARAVAAATTSLARAGLPPRLLVDCSHDNSGKSHLRQPAVLGDVARQVRDGAPSLVGVMVEGHLEAGKQELPAPDALATLRYGQSITDACVDFATGEAMLLELAAAHAARPRLPGERASISALAANEATSLPARALAPELAS